MAPDTPIGGHTEPDGDGGGSNISKGVGWKGSNILTASPESRIETDWVPEIPPMPCGATSSSFLSGIACMETALLVSGVGMALETALLVCGVSSTDIPNAFVKPPPPISWREPLPNLATHGIQPVAVPLLIPELLALDHKLPTKLLCIHRVGFAICHGTRWSQMQMQSSHFNYTNKRNKQGLTLDHKLNQGSWYMNVALNQGSRHASRFVMAFYAMLNH